MKQQATLSVPETTDTYSSQTITFDYPVSRLTVIVLEDPPTDGSVVVDVKDDAGTWRTDLASLTEKGISEVADFVEPLVEVRVRGKSGGTSGDVDVICVGSRARSR